MCIRDSFCTSSLKSYFCIDKEIFLYFFAVENDEDVYKRQAQNLDLTPYAGKRAKRWTYNIKNYPGYEGDSGTVQANILVYEGDVYKRQI